jgi:enamine deaminase RidA (YjgF/YER057c/UK114 family)
VTRRLVSSGGPWEASAGYSRAVALGDACWVAGTTDAGPDGRSRHPGDSGAQARAALDVIGAALAESGFTMAEVVRVRVYVTDMSRSGDVLAALGDVFRDVRPAATLVAVSALIDPTLEVEIEVDAARG